MKKKTIALLLGMAMLFAAFAPGVFAEEANTSTPAPTETPVETPVETPTVTPTDAPAGDATAEPTAPTTKEPTTQPTTEPTVEPTETPVVCTCEGTEEEKAAEGFVHNEDCPLYVAPEAEPATPTPVITLRDITEGAVTVSGLIPSDVTLEVTDLNSSMLRTMALNDAPETRQAEEDTVLAKLDITLYNPDGSEWQPEEGEKVRVTLDAAALGLPEGLIYSVRHIHENEDGTSTEELLGPYAVRDGKAVFDLASFSYVIIIQVNGVGTIIKNVQSFYTVSGGAGNEHIYASGVYFTQEGNAHLLLTSNHEKHAMSVKATEVTIGDLKLNTLGSTANYGPVSEFKLQNGENTSDVTNLLVHSGYNYVIDIDLGKISLTETFMLSVKWNNGTMGGFAINGMQVQVVFNDGISKEVYSVNGNEVNTLGETPKVKAGDEIIYKIVVANGADSTQPVSGSVVDTLPVGIFATGQICYSTDSGPTSETIWNQAEVTDNQFTLESGITLEMGKQIIYYIKATVKPDAAVGSYENKATFNNREATATVQVTAPPVADLTIRKQGCENIDENQSFLFDVTGPENYSVRVVVHGNGSATIKDLPLGEYTVTEDTGWSWRYTLEPKSQTVTLSAEEPKTVVFTNKRSAIYWLNGCAWCDNRWIDYNAIHDNDN